MNLTGHGRGKTVSYRHRLLSVGTALLVFLACARSAFSAEGPGPTSGTGLPLPGSPAADPKAAAESALTLNTPSNTLAARAAEIRVALAQATARANASESNAPAGMPVSDALVRRALLQRLVRIYEQQLSDLAELETTKLRQVELSQQVRQWTGFGEARPYSVVLVDELRGAVKAEELRMRGDQQALSALDGLITENRATLALADEKIRRLNEQLEGNVPAAALVALSWRRDLEQIRSQVASAAVALLDLERQLRQENLAASRSHLELLQKQLIVANSDRRFTQTDLDQVVAGLERDRLQLEHDLADAEQRQAAAAKALDAAREESKRSGATADATAAELLGVRTAQLENADTAARVLRLRLEAASIERTSWELRFAAYGSRQMETLRDSEARLQTLFKRAALWKEYFRQKLDTSATQLALEEGRLAKLGPAAELAPLARERLAALRERDEWLLSMERCGERLERLLQRWHEDVQRDIDRLPFANRVRHLFSSTAAFLSNLWTFELFTAEDTITVDGQKISGKRSVTLGKIASAILILIVGYWITGLVSEAGRRLLQKWLHVEPNQGQLIRRWMRATLVVCLVLFSLVSVKIPLTIFAFAGGALAIGIGFGTQTILKNVVSGLIILFEQPFRVGDVLDVGGQKGTLTSIGLRASVLQLWDGTETLFPNSNLLENALTNWTYSNGMVRFTVTVSVAYGSDTRRVTQLLEEAVARHGQIETNPKPQVFFIEFAESTLIFELRFWLDVLKTNPAQVSSDLRHMIAGTFSQNDIVIAFPQRSVHLNAGRPLQVEVVPLSAQPHNLGDGPNGRSPDTNSQLPEPRPHS